MACGSSMNLVRNSGRSDKSTSRATTSGEDALDDLAVHVGEAEVAARVAVGEPGVVQAHQVEDRGVEVVDMHGVFGHAVAQLVGAAVAEPGPGAPADEEAGEAGVVVAAAPGGQVLPGGAAELGAADDQ